MKIPRLLLDYARYSDAALALKAANIKASLTGNANFPTTTPSLADFGLLQTDFEQALSKTVMGDRVLIAAKNQSRLTLIQALRQLALDIDAQANGDKGKLLSSGLDLAATGDSVSQLKSPTDFKVLDGLNAGEIKFSCKRDDAAVSYSFEYTDEIPTENTKWTAKVSSSRECVVKGLRSGIRIYGRVTANGRRGQAASSEVLSRLVQ